LENKTRENREREAGKTNERIPRLYIITRVTFQEMTE
jgi:hypothetical protein